MKVLTFFPPCRLRKRLSTILASRQVATEPASSANECLQSASLKEYEGILIDTDQENYGDVLVLVRLLHRQRPNTAIFVFERHLDLDQRLQLLEAGVDDCVREPLVAAEFALRWTPRYGCIRPRLI